MYRNLVFEGGGVNGSAYVGCINALHEFYGDRVKSIDHFAGSSVGSLIATALACNATPNYIGNMIHNLDFKSFEDGSWLAAENVWRLFTEYGFYKGDALLEYVGNFLQELVGSSEITFAQLYEKTKNVLVITGSNINYRRVFYFDKEHTPDMPIEVAVRISASFPLFFKAEQWPNPEKVDEINYWCDGGLFDNYPIEIFDTLPEEAPGGSGHYNPQTLGFRLDQSILIPRSQPTPINNAKNYLLALGSSLYEQAQRVYVKEKDRKRSIIIDVGNSSSLNFDITEEEKDKLIQAGYEATKSFLSKN